MNKIKELLGISNKSINQLLGIPEPIDKLGKMLVISKADNQAAEQAEVTSRRPL